MLTYRISNKPVTFWSGRHGECLYKIQYKSFTYSNGKYNANAILCIANPYKLSPDFCEQEFLDTLQEIYGG